MPLYIVYQTPANLSPDLPSPVASVIVEADDERDAAESAVSSGGFMPGVISVVSVDLGKDFDMTLATDLVEKTEV